MAFVKGLAQGGLFGLAGLAASGGHKNKDKKPAQSLVTGDYPQPTQASLLNSKSIY